mgnify:CR=1 FL=1
MKKILVPALVLLISSNLILAQNPLAIPDTVSGSVINLTLQTGSVQFKPGAATSTMGANGNILGPTVILQKHQQVTLNVNNQLGEPTTIHWHGLHVAPENDGGPHIIIPPGATWSPSFEVLDWASTYWYHPHLHHHTNEHVQKGIAGFIISRDATESAINLPRTYGVDDFPLLVQTKAFDANNQIIPMSDLDSNLMVNATINPYLDIPAQVVRLRLLNGSSQRYYNFGFSNNLQFHQIATDAGLLTAPVALTRIMVAPGERAEILVNASALQGQTIYLMNYGAELPNAIYGALQPGMGGGQTIPNYSLNPINGTNRNVLQLNIVAPTANPVTTIPSALVTHTPWLATQANLTRTLTFTSTGQGPNQVLMGPFQINGAFFDMDIINFEVPENNIEIWQLTNQSPIGHPFHLHGFPFYVLDINGNPPPPHLAGRKDVIDVSAGMGTVRFITKFENFTNDSLPYMYHCHMLFHEEDGMMGQFLVKAPCALAINTQPQNVTALLGTNAQFTVQVNDPNAPLQWQTDIGFGFQNLTNTGQYSGVTTNTLTVSNVTLTNNNQIFRCLIGSGFCADTTDIVTLNVTQTSVSEILLENEVYIYPNPAKDFVYVNANKNINSNYSLSNFLGKEVMRGEFKSDRNKLDISELSNGLYYLKIEKSGKTVKIIKN